MKIKVRARARGREAAVATALVIATLGSGAVAADAAPRPTDAACPAGRVPSAGFTDTDGSSFSAEIDCIVWWGIATGRSSTTYGPTLDINRAQMATFLANLVKGTDGTLPSSPPDAFGDDNGSSHEANINALAAAGIVTGTGPSTYNPSAPVTRAQMATFLQRTYAYRTHEELPVSRDYFTDDSGSPHERSINQVAEAGIAAGDADGNYRPSASVRRDQMAAFVARTLDLLVDTGHATPPPPPPAVLGFDLKSVASSNGGWSISDASNCNGLLKGTQSISGTQHEKALYCNMQDRTSSTHTGWNEYDLGRSYTRFTTTVGEGDTSADTSDTIRFTVYGDGVAIGTIEVAFGQPHVFDLDVTGVLRLRIEVADRSHDNDDGSAVAVWGTPTVR